MATMLDATEMVPGLLWQGGTAPEAFSDSVCMHELVGELCAYDVVFACAPVESRLLCAGVRHTLAIVDLPFADDIQPPSQRELTRIRILTAAVVAAMTSRSKTLVLCREGRNRSGLIVALAMRRYCNIPASVAIQHIRERRPKALTNPFFVDLIWEVEL